MGSTMHDAQHVDWCRLLDDLKRREDFDTARLITRWKAYKDFASSRVSAIDALLQIDEGECLREFGSATLERHKAAKRSKLIDAAVEAMRRLTPTECAEAMTRRLKFP